VISGFFGGGGQKSCPRNPNVHSSKGEEQRQFCSMSWSRKPERLGKMQIQAHKTDRTGVLSLKCPQLTDLAVSHFRGPLQFPRCTRLQVNVLSVTSPFGTRERSQRTSARLSGRGRRVHGMYMTEPQSTLFGEFRLFLRHCVYCKLQKTGSGYRPYGTK
jgi:hypothetical protein